MGTSRGETLAIKQFDKKTLDFSHLTDGSNQITLQLASGDGAVDFFVDWGDGNIDFIKSYDDANKTHTYSSSGEKRIRIYKNGKNGTLGNQLFYKANSESFKQTHSSYSWKPTTLRQFFGFFTYNGLGYRPNVYYNGDTSFPESMPIIRSSGNHPWNSLPDMSDWDTSNVTDMYYMFSNIRLPIYLTNLSMDYNMNVGRVLDDDTGIGNWDTSSVTGMHLTFISCEVSTDLSNWDTSSVTNMSSMFARATLGSGVGIENWDISSVTGIGDIFSYSNIDVDLGAWNFASATSMQQMFYNCSNFNNGGSSSISGWNFPNCTVLQSLFEGATSFNQPIGNWDTSNVEYFTHIFRNAASFNQDLSNWDFSSVSGSQSMRRMFSGATSFNNGGSSGINSWFQQPVYAQLDSMFMDASGFNQPVGSWDTSHCLNMNSMFKNAASFDQDISTWDFTGNNGTYSMYDFMNGASLSTSNYDSLLVSWASQASSMPSNMVGVHMGSSTYTANSAAATARSTLVNTYGWTITDGGTA